MSEELVSMARAGDREAFGALVDPHRVELQVHCYRMLGSLQDAEDVLQETLLAAWMGIDGFESRSSVRTWLYRIATNRCLNHLRSDTGDRSRGAARVPAPSEHERADLAPALPRPAAGGLPDDRRSRGRYESREAITLGVHHRDAALPRGNGPC